MNNSNKRVQGAANLKDDSANRKDNIRIVFMWSLVFGVGVTIPTLLFIFRNGGFGEFVIVCWDWLNFGLSDGVKSTVDSEKWKATWDGYWDIRMFISGLFILSSFFGGSWGKLKIDERAALEAEGRNLREGEPRLVSPNEVILDTKNRVKDKKNNEVLTELDFHISDSKVIVTSKMSSVSFLVVGSPGAGKSVFIDEILLQALTNGQKCFVIDLNGDFYAKHGKSTDIVLSLHDRRAQKWDFWSEGELSIIAEGLIPPRKDESSESRFWQTKGRELALGILRQCNSVEELFRIANFSFSELREFLDDRRDISRACMGTGDSKLGEGVANVALASIKIFISHFNHWIKDREMRSGVVEDSFSLRNWVLDPSDTRSVFVVATEAHWEETLPLISLWTSIVSKAILELPENGPSKGCIFIDELASVNYISSLVKITQRGRKANWNVVLGMQSISQLDAIYGRDETKDIINNLQNKICFRVSDPALAELMSKTFGSEEKEFVKTGRTLSENGGASINTEVKTVDLVTPAQLLYLPERTAYVKLAMSNVTKLSWTYVSYPARNPSSRSESLKVKHPYLTQMPHMPYVNLFDQKRLTYLEKLKASCEELIFAFQVCDQGDVLSQERLRLAAKECCVLLGTASSISDKVFGKSYELSLERKKLSVRRDSLLIEVDLTQKPYLLSSNDEELG